MRVNIVGRDFTVKDEDREYAESKTDKLVRYFDLTQLITFTMNKKDNKGEYEVECIVDVEKHDDFVSTAEAQEAKAAIDAATEKSARQLSDFKEKLKQSR